jgi:N-acetyl-gamma-glutamyl-phosphate reductase
LISIPNTFLDNCSHATPVVPLPQNGSKTKPSGGLKQLTITFISSEGFDGIAPVLGIIDASDIVVVAASGTTGAGRNATINLIASEVMGSLTSYKFGGVHQHTPEIEQALSALVQKQVKVSFTPILAPMPRGILATITAKLNSSLTTQQAQALFVKHYASEFFVDVLPSGQMPKTSAVTGSNKAQLQVAVDEHTNRIVVSVAIDNLGKGAAGQAIQNANLICGLSEISGLALDGIGS